MKIVIALDSFKGCIDSPHACMAVQFSVMQEVPMSNIVTIHLSDGGEGMTEIITLTERGKSVWAHVHDARMKKRTAIYGLINKDPLNHIVTSDMTTAVIDMATTCGLGLIPKTKKNPETTTTYGFGEVILDALNRGCKTLVLGIGGSSTNDAGMGMLQALGARIEFDETVAPDTIATGGNLSHIRQIDVTPLRDLFKDISILVAADVKNPLFGPEGAAFVYAPQKGANAEAVERLDAGLRHIFSLSGETQSLPGDGAAGGLGFALRTFLKAELRPGIEIMLDLTNFDEKIADADLIITGEGKCDATTLNGKVPIGVLEHAKKRNIPVHVIAGIVEDADLLLEKGFAGVHCINEGVDAPLSEMIQPQFAFKQIQKTVSRLIRSLKS